MDALRKQRASYELALSRQSKFARKLTVTSTESLDKLRLRANRAHDLLAKFGQIEADMFAINAEEKSRLFEAEELYFSAAAKINEIVRLRSLQETTNHGESSMNATIGSAAPAVKLAKLQIPHFDGDYTEWQSFFDIFASSIHENETIPTVQKFQYLVGLLKGEAYSLVRHYKITEANYHEALQKLTQRYNRKRHTINLFIRKFIEQPNVKAASSDNLRKILDTSDEVIRGLRALSEKAESRDPWLIYMIVQKLDDDTRNQWAQDTTEHEYPTLKMLFEFLNKRVDALESLRCDQVRPARSNTQIHLKRTLATFTKWVCVACNIKDHKLIECDKFKELSVEDRKILLSKNKRCFNCFNSNHTVYDCKSRSRCRLCSQRHNTLLHTDGNISSATEIHESRTNEAETLTNCTQHNNGVKENGIQELTILPTAMIYAIDSNGTRRPCRALLDTASQASFVTEAFVQKLGLRRVNGRTIITGIGQTGAGKSHGIAKIRFTSRFCDKPVELINAFIISKITSPLPGRTININHLSTIASSELADPYFNKPATIDILLGADIIFNLFDDGIQRIGPSNLMAQNTKLGWIIGGVYDGSTAEPIRSLTTQINIDETLRRFWEIEEFSADTNTRYTEEEQSCEQFFQTTTSRSSDGRFITRLPFKENKMEEKLSQTYDIALSRLLAMEKRFRSDSEFQRLYVDFMGEYQELGHMTEVDINERDLRKMYILPHHGVRKDSSLTTKLRVVFDASAKCGGCCSLNEKLMIGPTVQANLLEILLRFRQHRYVLVGDLEKMYRQVLMHEEDRKHQIILWRDEQQCIKPYALNTVTYGTASASFMATRCLVELSKPYSDEFPEAARAIEKDVYVDDLMTGAATLPQLQDLKHSIVRIMQSGGFNLRKLSSNHNSIINQTNQIDSGDLKQLSEHEQSIKLLGIAWQSSTDRFIFQAKISTLKNYTKRNLLSEASRIFDPLGLISPIVIRVKILFQKLWLLKLDWDEELPTDIKMEWAKLRTELCSNSKIEIPRWMGTTTTVRIHGFCDASKWAYAAVLYAITESSDGVHSHLICSKSKVAPLKQVSLPRLELMGAVLLSRVTKQAVSILNLEISQITLWTDSKIVLDWLSDQPRRWTTFVANRTAEIINEHNRSMWRHVPSKENPADYATRGKSYHEIARDEFWWNGPQWLREDRAR